MIDSWRGYLGAGTLRGISALRGTVLLEGTAVLRGTALSRGSALIRGTAAPEGTAVLGHQYVALGPYCSGLWGWLSGCSGVFEWGYLWVEGLNVLSGSLVLLPLDFNNISLGGCC